MKKVAITGGAGFIGYWTAKRLVGEGFEVKILDNLHTASMIEKVRELGLQVMKVDVRNLDALEKTLQGSNCVIHLAALLGVEESLKKILSSISSLDNLAQLTCLIFSLHTLQGYFSRCRLRSQGFEVPRIRPEYRSYP